MDTDLNLEHELYREKYHAYLKHIDTVSKEFKVIFDAMAPFFKKYMKTEKSNKLLDIAQVIKFVEDYRIAGCITLATMYHLIITKRYAENVNIPRKAIIEEAKGLGLITDKLTEHCQDLIGKTPPDIPDLVTLINQRIDELKLPPRSIYMTNVGLVVDVREIGCYL